MKVKNIVFFGFAAAILSGTANADPLQVASTAYVTSQLSTKADASTTYSKTEVNGLLNDKQDVIDDLSDIRSGAALGATALQQAALNGYATTQAMNTALEGKADASTTYTKTEVDALLDDKADASDLEGYVTDSDLTTALAGKQDSLSEAQLAAANSGITAAKVSTYDGYATTIAGKQDSLSEAQLAAANSGITAEKVATYDGYAATIATKANASALEDYATTQALTSGLAGKQDSLSEAQLAAANSGITAAKVTSYDGYATTIAGKQDSLSEAQLAAANSGITAAKVTSYDGYAATIADKADDSDLTALETRVETAEGKIGTGNMSVGGNQQSTIVAAINALDAKTTGIATQGNLETLESSVTALSNTVGSASGGLVKDVADNTDAISDIQTDLAGKANAATTYTKSEVDTALGAKADSSTVTALDTRVGSLETKATGYDALKDILDGYQDCIDALEQAEGETGGQCVLSASTSGGIEWMAVTFPWVSSND